MRQLNMENPPTADATQDISALRRKLEEAQQEARRLDGMLAEARKLQATAERERIERFRELARMAELVIDKDRELARAKDLKDWLERFVGHLLDRPWWWSLLPARMRKAKERAMLRRARIFDAKGYLAIHPDVRTSGVDALHHYVEYGMAEGRARDGSAARNG